MSKKKLRRILEGKAEKVKEIVENAEQAIETVQESGEDIAQALGRASSELKRNFNLADRQAGDPTSAKLKEDFNLAEKQAGRYFSTPLTQVKKQVSKSIRKIKDYGAAKVENAVGQFKSSLPAIENAGFELRGVNINVGVIPNVIAIFGVKRYTDDEEQEKILQETGGDRLLETLLKSLFQAENIQKTVDLPGMDFDGVSVSFGSVPKVSLRFRK